MLINNAVRLSPPCVGIEVEPDWHDCSIHPLPPCAFTIARVRQSGIGQKKRSPGRPRVRRIIESVRWGA
jgi:hypothetical protein